MKITNPTNNEISIQFKGIVYTIPARGSISQVTEDVATYWKTMIHEFIQVSEDEVVIPVEEKKEVKKEVEVEEVEEIVEVKKPVISSKKK